MKNLTVQEQNLIKDILKVIGNDDEMNASFAQSVGMTERGFNEISDLIFNKLQNGRLTLEGE